MLPKVTSNRASSLCRTISCGDKTLDVTFSFITNDTISVGFGLQTYSKRRERAIVYTDEAKEVQIGNALNAYYVLGRVPIVITIERLL